MEMVLIREKLWGIVCERRTKPESGAKAQADFEEDAESATATIFLYLSETAERYVRDVRDPVALWAKLKEVFFKVGFAVRYNLWKKLFSIEVGYKTKECHWAMLSFGGTLIDTARQRKLAFRLFHRQPQYILRRP
jgi:hypothetical protein